MRQKIDASVDGMDQEYLLHVVRAIEILDGNNGTHLSEVEVSFKKRPDGYLDTHFSITVSDDKKITAFFQSSNGYKPSGEQMAALLWDKIMETMAAK